MEEHIIEMESREQGRGKNNRDGRESETDKKLKTRKRLTLDYKNFLMHAFPISWAWLPKPSPIAGCIICWHHKHQHLELAITCL